MENVTCHGHACCRFSRVQLFATLWTIACQAPLSMGFSRREYWSEWPGPSPGDLPNPGIKPQSQLNPTAGRFSTTSAVSVNKGCWGHWAGSHCSRPYCAPWEDSGWRETGDWPSTTEMGNRGTILISSDSSSHTQKSKLKSLTWDIWLNSNLVRFQLPGLCYKNSWISWLFPHLFKTVPQSYLGFSP